MTYFARNRTQYGIEGSMGMSRKAKCFAERPAACVVSSPTFSADGETTVWALFCVTADRRCVTTWLKNHPYFHPRWNSILRIDHEASRVEHSCERHAHKIGVASQKRRTPGTPSTHDKAGRRSGERREEIGAGERGKQSGASRRAGALCLSALACDFFPFLSLSGRRANRSK